MTENDFMSFRKPLRVLLVEDNEVDCKMLESILQESSPHIEKLKTVRSLVSALKILNEENFDVIILDLNLPDSKGKETLIKVTKQFPMIPVVVNTGAFEDEMGLETLRLGAQDFLVKGKYSPYLLNKTLRYAIERKRSEAELLEATIKLKETQGQLIQSEKMKVVGGLASGIAHEVKNPLATILFGITYLSENLKNPDSKVSLVLESIQKAANKANEIVSDLLNFAVLNKLKKQNENLNSIIEQALILLHYELQKHNIEVVKDFAADLPEINIDKNRIEQVIINLLLNAVYAMPEGGKIVFRTYVQTLEQSLNGFLSGERVVVADLEDSGCGINAEDLDKVFDPFFTTRRANGGVGLGLAVSKNIIENHRGHISIENLHEKGARARLCFHLK